ncbi:hypothetical protein [Antribacter gilvus]|uniref:hypothetical protein n=1 Tax=Antribacter gilvus TaxID=2304675 RepID=UPI0013DE860D|nr:hypothetical protein [Antribacter gilvus]
MYGLIWRLLPGPVWLRAILALLLAALAVAACFEWLFPWLAEYMPFNETTVGAAAA